MPCSHRKYCFKLIFNDRTYPSNNNLISFRCRNIYADYICSLRFSHAKFSSSSHVINFECDARMNNQYLNTRKALFLSSNFFLLFLFVASQFSLHFLPLRHSISERNQIKMQKSRAIQAQKKPRSFQWIFFFDLAWENSVSLWFVWNACSWFDLSSRIIRG